MKFKLNNRQLPGRRGERGYALVGMIGVMLFALILTTATAPSIKFEMQREKEEEMLYRGQQVADALGRYFNNGPTRRYPTDLKELVDGVTIGVRKTHFLRPSALCDPMTSCNPGTVNWKLVHQGDPLVRELYEAYIALQQGGQLTVMAPPDFMRQAQLAGVQLPGQPADTKLDGNAMAPTEGNAETESESGLNKLPILGVVSRKSGTMFRNYYGIQQYDHSLFFAGLGVVASGFTPGVRLSGGGTLNNGQGANGTVNVTGGGSPCPFGGVRINGQCAGGMYPGPQQRPGGSNP
ncbi:MAG TPA: hypothetical protein VJ302_22325 [Blastocatellia bacterium]|nr:hypothetical protein [Blastocatellia bacterium]